jgi:sarcosine oxidase, subunit beta
MGTGSEVQTSKRQHQHAVVVNAAGPWAKAIGRYCGVDVPVEPERRHIFIATPERGGSWDAPEWDGRMPRSRVLVIDFESTFYFHREGPGLLFGMGDPDETAGLRHHRALGLPAEGHRGGRAPAAGHGRRRRVARVGRAL